MLCEATSMCVGTLWRSVIVRVSVHVAASACKCEVCDSVPSTKSETESRGRAAGSCSRVSRRVRVQERARFRWYPRGGAARATGGPGWRCGTAGDAPRRGFRATPPGAPGVHAGRPNKRVNLRKYDSSSSMIVHALYPLCTPAAPLYPLYLLYPLCTPFDPLNSSIHTMN